MIDISMRCRVFDCGDGLLGLEMTFESGNRRVYKGLTSDEARLRELAQRIERLGVSELHADDIIEDFVM
jgi:hypothetical protein